MGQHHKCEKQSVVISCFYNAASGPPTLPVGFSWANVLSSEFKNKYKVTILLHGENIPYGLNDKAYESKFNQPNPYRAFLNKMNCRGVKIVICDLCLKQDGYDNKDLICYVKPVKFSIDFIAESVKKGKVVVYDAQMGIKN